MLAWGDQLHNSRVYLRQETLGSAHPNTRWLARYHDDDQSHAPVYLQYTQEFFHRMVRSCANLLTAYSVGKCSGSESGGGTLSSSIMVSARLPHRSHRI